MCYKTVFISSANACQVLALCNFISPLPGKISAQHEQVLYTLEKNKQTNKPMNFRFICLTEKTTVHRKQAASLRNAVQNHK